MFDEIGGMQNVVPWIKHELDGGSRLMGFGHRVYRTRGPRADVLKDIVGSLDQSTDRMQFAEALERAVLDALAACDAISSSSSHASSRTHTKLAIAAISTPLNVVPSA